RIPVDVKRGRLESWDTIAVVSGLNRFVGYDLAGDGNSLVYAAETPATYQVWAVEQQNGEPRPIRLLRRSSAFTYSNVSRDGRTVFFNSSQTSADRSRTAWFAHAFDGGEAHQVTPFQSGERQYAISLDGRHLFELVPANAGHSTLVRWNVADGSSRQLADLPDEQHTIQEGPDGGVLLVNPRADTVKVLDTEGNITRSLVVP